MLTETIRQGYVSGPVPLAETPGRTCQDSDFLVEIISADVRGRKVVGTELVRSRATLSGGEYRRMNHPGAARRDCGVRNVLESAKKYNKADDQAVSRSTFFAGRVALRAVRPSPRRRGPPQHLIPTDDTLGRCAIPPR